MAIIKNTFSAGRMNKDLDERLIPKGEYREAYNIEVNTTNGSSAGTAQNIRGNKYVGSTSSSDYISESNCVGGVVDEKSDNCYFFFASEDVDTENIRDFDGDYKDYSDYIIEQNVSGLTKPVVVDRWGLLVKSSKITDPTYYFRKLEVDDIDKYYVGMHIVAIRNNGSQHPINGSKITKIYGNYIVLDKTFSLTEWNGANYGEALSCLFLTKPKALDLKPNQYITGANVIDGFLTWTTDYSEPRKINIERCKKGTPTDTTQTSLYVKVNGELILAGEDDSKALKNSLIENSDLLLGNPTNNEVRYWEVENVTYSALGNVSLGDNSSLIYKPSYYRSLEDQISSVVEYGKTYTIKINITTNMNPGSQTLKLSSTVMDVGGYGEYGTFDTSSIGEKTLTFTAIGGIIRISSDLAGISISDIELSEVSNDVNIPLQKDHTTLIRKSPRKQPTVVANVESTDLGKKWNVGSYSGFIGSAGLAVGEGSSGVIPNMPSSVSFSTNDSLKISSVYQGETYSVFVKVTDIVDGNLYYYILSINSKITANNNNWTAELDFTSNNIFENQFVRFATRYIYSDGEHSTFSPWSEPVFQPGSFDYDSKQGYNLSMVNRVKEIKLIDLVPKIGSRPDDVVGVDVLFKSSDSSSVYTVKTINRGVDGEWITGEMVINNEMIHEVVPSDQIVRSWDNVPKTAKAQEIIGNRLVFGNYTQGYDINFKPSVLQYLKTESEATVSDPKRSIKSMRSYKVGVVFGDKYGRETPVIAINNKSFKDGDNIQVKGYDSFHVDKKYSKNNNKLVVKQDWVAIDGSIITPEPWMEYAKYYIKETSQEYYNLVMDRWYKADDGNIWLSFPSSDRNKIDEDTFLILKNAHGSNDVVESFNRNKVISISNEAPRSIKSRLRSLAKFTIPEDYYEKDANDDLSKLIENTDLLVSKSDYNSATGGDDIKFKGSPKVRLILVVNGQRYTTPIKSLVNFKKPVDGNDGKITIGLPFGQSANFYKKLVNNDTYADIAAASSAISYDTNVNIFYEILDEVIEEKSEYEGKFFVKIARNDEVREFVINSTQDAENYELVSEIALSYINTQSSSNGYTGPKSSYTWGTNNTWLGNNISISSSDISSGNFLTKTKNGVKKTAKFWRDFTRNRVDEKPPSSAIFIDEAPYIRGYILGSNRGSHTYHDGEALFASSQCKQGVDTIRLSIPKLPQWKQGSTSDTKGLKMLTRKGCIFSFADDPKGTKYRVSNVQVGGYDLSNYGDDETNFYPAQPDNADVEYIIENYGRGGRNTRKVYKATLKGSWSERTRYNIRFERLTDKGIIVPLSGLDLESFDPRGYVAHDGTELSNINIYASNDLSDFDKDTSVEHSAIWETEPKPGTELDIYYEASQAIPMKLSDNNVHEFAPLNSSIGVLVKNLDGSEYKDESYGENLKLTGVKIPYFGIDVNNALVAKNIDIGDYITFTSKNGTVTKSEVLNIGEWYDSVGFSRNPEYILPGTATTNSASITGVNTTSLAIGMKVKCVDSINNDPYSILDKGATITNINNATTVTVSETLRSSGSFTFKFVNPGTHFELDTNVHSNEVQLPWFNCFSYGNGLESNRIRDDFNAPTISNGVKASTTFLGYGEEKNYNGLIYSGIINASSKVNKLHEFNMGQKITKDINPDYGSIQVIKSRNSDLNVFTQDKVLKVLANKDALYNADGNVNITSTDRVLGQAIPYTGDFGISEDPTSLAWDQYRMYFTDKQRGAVLRLSNDGLTPISDIGMKKWFREALKNSKLILGSFDVVSGEYNLTIEQKDAYVGEVYELDYAFNSTRDSQNFNTYNTLSFSERGKGWVSFKSWHQNVARSFAGEYFTTRNNEIWMHNSSEVNRLSFYGESNVCRIIGVLNDNHDIVKNFKSMEYSGSQAAVRNLSGTTTDVNGNTVNYFDGRYDRDTGNLLNGWSVALVTDISQAAVGETFVQRDGKWFGTLFGNSGGSTYESDPSLSSGIGKPKSGSPITTENQNGEQVDYTQQEINIEINLEDIT